MFVGVFASLAIFASTRMFAKPAPHTMNKEWQEAANEYLKVRSSPEFAREPCLLNADMRSRNKKPSPSPATPLPITRARDRFSPLPRMLRRIHQSSGSDSSGRSSLSHLLLEREKTQSFFHGLTSMYKMILRRSIGPARGWMMAISCVDVNRWCTRIPKPLPTLGHPNLRAAARVYYAGCV